MRAQTSCDKYALRLCARVVKSRAQSSRRLSRDQQSGREHSSREQSSNATQSSRSAEQQSAEQQNTEQQKRRAAKRRAAKRRAAKCRNAERRAQRPYGMAEVVLGTRRKLQTSSTAFYYQGCARHEAQAPNLIYCILLPRLCSARGASSKPHLLCRAEQQSTEQESAERQNAVCRCLCVCACTHTSETCLRVCLCTCMPTGNYSTRGLKQHRLHAVMRARPLALTHHPSRTLPRPAEPSGRSFQTSTCSGRTGSSRHAAPNCPCAPLGHTAGTRCGP